MQVTLSPSPVRGTAPAISDAAKPAPQEKTRPTGESTSVPIAAGVVSSRVQATLTAIATDALIPTSSRPASFYEQFMPTRDGAPATALARAIVDPGAVSSSAGKTSKEVATDARARMDANYGAMAASGKPFDIDSFEGKDWYSLLGDLDRRSLNAVSINSGGLFSKQEQDIAQSIMSQQQGWAMGLGGGPTRLMGKFVDPYSNDNAGHAAKMKAAAKFLDAVSPDEKMTIAWASQRAAVEWSYEAYTKDEGGFHESLTSEDPTVQLIKAAMNTMSESLDRDTTYGSLRTTDDLKRQPWFQGFEDRLDAAIAKSRSMYEAQLSQSS